MSTHVCCACFTHNNLPCCNEGHIDWTGVQRIRSAWSRSPLLRSVRAHREKHRHDYRRVGYGGAGWSLFRCECGAEEIDA